MDGQAILLSILGGGGVMVTVGIAIGKSMTTHRDIRNIDGRVHKLSNKLQAYPDKPDEVFARKDVIGAQLAAIHQSLEDVKGTLKTFRSGV